METSDSTLALAKLNLGDENELNSLREIVHSLCQVANPLGKMIDFLKEDVETMNKEHQFWVKDLKVHQDQSDEERRVTEELLEDEAGELSELKEKIEYQQRRIFSLKGEILKNEETIMKYLRMVTSPNPELDLDSLLKKSCYANTFLSS
ncbi:hypothetical protein GOP47_0002442 [Adiantum capillus-veneris]|uniref:TRAF3-interacting protein 1 C-terminal domain-containing protein n=1 Tax=Adiantum capillus-veneris TaxID=13818 RepID=A0A9D4VAY1_ADICA|nr:hypothetical protein GOP47_0002442 [Adiantum capillus-veneris]